mmetsp:Transcript_14387/g.37869  ORF Transcript_14387/g.37869 Transcript_14387/m.37869 type:complete len:182 (-) Transcript_14387:184-729(-)
MDHRDLIFDTQLRVRCLGTRRGLAATLLFLTWGSVSARSRSRFRRSIRSRRRLAKPLSLHRDYTVSAYLNKAGEIRTAAKEDLESRGLAGQRAAERTSERKAERQIEQLEVPSRRNLQSFMRKHRLRATKSSVAKLLARARHHYAGSLLDADRAASVADVEGGSVLRAVGEGHKGVPTLVP